VGDLEGRGEAETICSLYMLSLICRLTFEFLHIHGVFLPSNHVEFFFNQAVPFSP
jgi:hypothetical protein